MHSPVFFISDLHLCEERPHTTQLLLNFLATTARQAGALVVLGDLFEYWIGDDAIADDAHAQSVLQGFRALADAGTVVYLMHGNRDFLMGPRCAEAAGAILLEDPVCMAIAGQRVLLTHGDVLCTDDHAYQAFRQQVREAGWQHAFLQQPLATRRAQVEALRSRSESEKSLKAAAIMDVNGEAVEAILAAHDFPPLLIHGHTHRPDVHRHVVDGHACTRWVLADWHETGDYLRVDAQGCSRHILE